MIEDLNEFLQSRHPSSVLQFITGIMVEWTHFDKQKPPSKSNIDLAWRSFLDLLKNRIDTRLSLISSQGNSSARRKALRIPRMVYEKKKIYEVAVLLGGLPPDEAIDFIVEVTTNWCFSIPLNFLPLIPNDLRAEIDEAIAYAIYKWLVIYNDDWH